MQMRDSLIQDLKRDEGLVLHEYKDHLGFSTIGIGRLIDKRKGGGITVEEAEYLLGNDIDKVISQLKSSLPWYERLSDNRKKALCNMAFQMGISGLMLFRNTLKYIEQGNFAKAAENARESLWYKQTPQRAERVIQLILKG